MENIEEEIEYLYTKKKYKEFFKLLEQVLSDNPNSAIVYYYKARYYYNNNCENNPENMENWNKVLENIEHALSNDHMNFHYHLLKAICLLMLTEPKNETNAIKYLDDLIAQNPNNEDAYYCKKEFYESDERVKYIEKDDDSVINEATTIILQLLEKCLELNPLDEAIITQEYIPYIEARNEFERAIEIHEKTIKYIEENHLEDEKSKQMYKDALYGIKHFNKHILKRNAAYSKGKEYDCYFAKNIGCASIALFMLTALIYWIIKNIF